MQPLKVLVIAVFVALIIKKLDDEEKSAVEKQARVLARDEEWLHRPTGDQNEAETETASVKHVACTPPSKEELARARSEKIKEIKMSSITRELVFYVFFCFVVFVLGMSTRDAHGFDQTVSTREALQLDPRQTSKAFSYRTQYQFPKVCCVYI